MAFNQIIGESWIVSTFIIKNFSFLLLSDRNRVFEEVIFQISRKVNLRIFLLICFCVEIFHQSINIGIYLIGLSRYTFRIENRHFILVIFVLVLNAWTIRLLYTLVSKNSVKFNAFYFINISQQCLRLIYFCNTVLIQSVSDIRMGVEFFTCPDTVIHPGHVVLLKPFLSFLLNLFILRVNYGLYYYVALCSCQYYLPCFCHNDISDLFI